MPTTRDESRDARGAHRRAGLKSGGSFAPGVRAGNDSVDSLTARRLHPNPPAGVAHHAAKGLRSDFALGAVFAGNIVVTTVDHHAAGCVWGR
jgi:hypothetical protein